MPDLRLSVSKTKSFLDCKKKFKFAYVLKLPQKEFEFHTFGKFCHKVLEDFHLEYINGSTEPYNTVMTKCFKQAVVEYKEKLNPTMQKECFDIIHAYLKKLYIQKKSFDGKLGKSPTNVLAVEKNFAINITDNLILNGMIDRVEIDDDGVLTVSDYKTTKNKKYLKEDWLQLATYAYVLYLENPDIKKIRGAYILLRHDFEKISKDFTIEEILAVKEKYLNYAETINMEKEYVANPSPLCKYCSFLDSCAEGKEKVGFNTTCGEVAW